MGIDGAHGDGVEALGGEKFEPRENQAAFGIATNGFEDGVRHKTESFLVKCSSLSGFPGLAVPRARPQ